MVCPLGFACQISYVILTDKFRVFSIQIYQLYAYPSFWA